MVRTIGLAMFFVSGSAMASESHSLVKFFSAEIQNQSRYAENVRLGTLHARIVKQSAFEGESVSESFIATDISVKIKAPVQTVPPEEQRFVAELSATSDAQAEAFPFVCEIENGITFCTAHLPEVLLQANGSETARQLKIEGTGASYVADPFSSLVLARQ